MNEPEQSKRTALPLAVAAARLGISPDALRMRVRRGKEKGFKRDGRLFVALSEQPNELVRSTAAAGEQARLERSRPSGHGSGAPADRTDSGPAPAAGGTADAVPDGLPVNSLPVIVEYQKVELTRLLRDNTRLNRRLDQLMDELRHLHGMQRREQVLRQQDQALRQQVQGTLERLTERLAPPGRGAAGGAAGPEPVYACTAEETTGAGTGQGPAAQSPEETYAGAADLAEILREVGASLRGQDAAPTYAPSAPAMPRAAPTEPRSPDLAQPGAGPMERAGHPFSPLSAERPEQLDDDEPRLLEILARMGPSAEDRRTAARLMKRLLRRRGAIPPHEPES